MGSKLSFLLAAILISGGFVDIVFKRLNNLIGPENFVSERLDIWILLWNVLIKRPALVLFFGGVVFMLLGLIEARHEEKVKNKVTGPYRIN